MENENGTATYCPEDNKLRLYVGRVPREEYDALRREGWTSTPKQACDFVSTWTPGRENTALEYSGGVIEDEDQAPQERAADRAERFSGYREKHAGEAADQADGYDAGPRLHGYQSAALAERRARQHDRLAIRAVNQWEKAEYWQYRTAEVIAHALHVSAPGVRMGRIKAIESELRGCEKTQSEAAQRWAAWEKVLTIEETTTAFQAAYHLANYGGGWYEYQHPRQEAKKSSLYSLLTDANDPITGHEAARLYLGKWKHPDDPGNSINRWLNHLRLRLVYENQMLEAQGGRLAAVDIEPGGWLGKRQIQKVNKSPATGRVVSVQVKTEKVSGWVYQVQNVPGTDYALLTIKTERLAPGAYRPPTEEERAAFEAGKKAEKAARGVVPIINPIRADAERLQAQINAQAAEADKGKNYPRKPGEVEENTQAGYSASYKDYRAMREIRGVCKVRVRVHGWQNIESVVILTDKPQKPLPAAVFAAEAAEQERATA